MQSVDVTVIGGGRAGCAAAIALSAAGRSVAVLERTHYERVRVGEILPPAAKPALCALGVWDRFQDSGFTRSPGIVSAWGQAQPYANDYIANPYGHGWHIDPSRFDRMLADAARAAGATVHTGAGAASCRRTGAGWLTMARAGDQQLCLRSDFVIDATGRPSWLARRLGQRRLVYDRLVAIVGVIDRAEDEQTRDRRTLIESESRRLVVFGGPVENAWRRRLHDRCRPAGRAPPPDRPMVAHRPAHPRAHRPDDRQRRPPDRQRRHLSATHRDRRCAVASHR